MADNSGEGLSAHQVCRFLLDGVLFLALDKPPAFHAALVEELAALLAASGDPGHALIPGVTRAQAVVDDPVLRRVLGGLLGGEYRLDPCRHVHLNSHPAPGAWHQDDYCQQARPADPDPCIPSLLMLCYFPQDTPPAMGPTGVMPGSQWRQTPPASDDGEVLASGPAGTCALLRLDLWHRATANTTGRQRLMLKFLFARGRA